MLINILFIILCHTPKQVATNNGENGLAKAHGGGATAPAATLGGPGGPP
jgi:hypothetical protein